MSEPQHGVSERRKYRDINHIRLSRWNPIEPLTHAEVGTLVGHC